MAKRIKKEKHKSKFFLWLLQAIFITMMIVSGIKIFLWWQDTKENDDLVKDIASSVVVEEIAEEEELKYKINFEELLQKNKDTVAWLKVEGTNIEYPVVQAKDNDYYLNHNFYKKSNGAGWIFADYRNDLDGTDDNVVVYGHSRTGGSMFGTLKNVLKKEWYNNKDNYQIHFNTKNEEAIYQVFSVYQIEQESYYLTTHFSNKKDFEKFLKTITKRSIKDFEVDVNAEDHILTLSTCAINNQYRVVLHAKKIENK